MEVTRSRIHHLSKLLPESDYPNPISSPPLSSRSLLTSSAVYTAVSSSLTISPTSGAGDDPICRWLYETYISSDHDLRLVVLSFIPLIAGNYLSRLHSLPSPVTGFEAVLLAVYSSETISRAGKPVVVTIPDLAQSSPYHIGSEKDNEKVEKVEKVVGIVSNPLEPQTVIKSSKRGVILGAVFDCYHKEISEMPDWSKLDFCKFVVDWAGQSCPCKSRFDQKLEIEMKDSEINDGKLDNVGAGGTRIPLPWELLQPVLRILAHCLCAPVVGNDVKDAASTAARFLYARSAHDLVPRAILATRALIQLHNREREDAKLTAVACTVGSDSNTPAKENKPEIQVVGK